VSTERRGAHERPTAASEHSFDASYWDERYRSYDSVWGLAPNRWVAQEVAELAADVSGNHALDLACGEGRNAVWLASRGWQVTAVDFSAVAIEKGRAFAESLGVAVHWRVGDVLSYAADGPSDLALLCYLQVPPAERRAAVTRAWRALGPGGTLLVIAHDSRNLAEGTGGPQRPEVLYTAEDIAGDLAAEPMQIDKADAVLRPVDGAERPAIDCLFRARRAG
jgi:SAM-dependent methyltransferase